MKLPTARGPLSAAVVEALRHPGDSGDELVVLARERSARERPGQERPTDVVTDEDVQLTLWVLYELHYQGFEDVDDDREWDPGMLRVRNVLEAMFEEDLRRRTAVHVDAALGTEGDVAERLFDLIEGFDGPPVSRFVQREANREQFLEFMTHRSIYHLKESDPHSWVIPRITGKPKAALVELQYDEYGAGRPERLHAAMFGDALAACGLDRAYGAYVDEVPGYTLAVNNAMSLLGLHRRLRLAAMGHLGAFEATSSLPCRRYATGVRRLDLPDAAAEYFEEHVEADAVHEQLALRDICAELVKQEPDLAGEVFFGAAVCLCLDEIAGERMLAAWDAGRSALRGDSGPDAMAS